MMTETYSTGERVSAEHYQIQSAKAAIAREMARMVNVSNEVLAAKVKADAALSEYRDAVRAAAREALERM